MGNEQARLTDTELIHEVVRRLEAAYGRQNRYSSKSPMDQLIATILSQRTNYADELLAFNKLKQEYGTWKSVAQAPVEKVQNAIQSVRYPELKAPRIQLILRKLMEEHGCLNTGRKYASSGFHSVANVCCAIYAGRIRPDISMSPQPSHSRLFYWSIKKL